MFKTKMYKDLKSQFAVYVSDTFMTLKQGQGNQTCYESVDPKHMQSLKDLF